MHKINNLLLIIFFLPYKFNSYAQDKVDAENYNIEIPNVPSQGKQHHAKITLINGQKLKGVITSIGDNGIQLEKVVYKKSKGGRPETQKPLSFNPDYAVEKKKERSFALTMSNKPSNHFCLSPIADMFSVVFPAWFVIQLPNAKHLNLKVLKVAWLLL